MNLNCLVVEEFHLALMKELLKETITVMSRHTTGMSYYEAFDLIVNCIENRFNKPGYKT